ncbi:hypothetical protein C8Q79DRAFT_1010953 [Trametes meyenii]|nr:hypothetical protein C8Q79DRAFT_1010953 [Trametes meyenii]
MSRPGPGHTLPVAITLYGPHSYQASKSSGPPSISMLDSAPFAAGRPRLGTVTPHVPSSRPSSHRDLSVSSDPSTKSYSCTGQRPYSPTRHKDSDGRERPAADEPIAALAFNSVHAASRCTQGSSAATGHTTIVIYPPISIGITTYLMPAAARTPTLSANGQAAGATRLAGDARSRSPPRASRE